MNDPNCRDDPRYDPEKLGQLPRNALFSALSAILPDLTFDDCLRLGPCFAAAIGELAPCLGFDQCSPHHRYDLYTHIAHVVAQMPRDDLPLRWAALLHDVGKPAVFTRDETGRGHFKGHAMKGAEMADAILCRLEAPEGFRKEVVRLIALHMMRLYPDEDLLRRCLTLYGKETVHRLLLLQQADMNSKGIPGEEQAERFQRTARMLRQINI